MRYLVLGLTATLLCCTAAFADTFNFSGGQVVTHRGTNIILSKGVNLIDRKNKVTCISDKGCSIVIQTQEMFYERTQSWTVCTLVDNMPADPPCQDTYLDSPNILTTFQGLPALTKGDHIVETEVTSGADGFHLLSFQVVYTLYQHQ